MMRAIWLFLVIPVGALVAIGLGALDFMATARAPGPGAASSSRIEIAPTSVALTFARSDGRTIAVTTYDAGRARAVALDALLAPGEDAIGLINRLGYDAVQAEIERAATSIEITASDLDIPVDLGREHIAVGTNYRQHAEEAAIEGGPFLFPKYVQPTSPHAPIPMGEALLDYEVELCLVTMRPLPPAERASGGLILCNDITDRATLLRELDPESPESGDGFTSGKSAPGFLPVGDLFVVPRDISAFAHGLELQLSVNGVERQRSPVSLWIWDIDRILVESSQLRDRSWAFGNEVARLPYSADGSVPERTLVLTGTPGGTVFKGIYPSAYVRGGVAWLAVGWDRSLPEHVVESHIATARASGAYLRPGDLVTIRVDQLGSLANPVE